MAGHAASGATSAQLRYDPLGRLHEVSGGAVTTRFLYDNDELVAEYDTGNTLLRRYLHGSGSDDPVIWYEGSTATPATRRHIFADRQGSIIGTTDTNGAIIQINRYDEWGLPDAANAGRFGYTGQAWIPELGLWHYKARFYSPSLGRFMQTDPIGYEDGINWYAYVGNDPVNTVDPTGMCSEKGDKYGCQVTEKTKGQPAPNAKQINPRDPAAVNGHAISGDGSEREADFTQVSIAGVGEQLHKIAGSAGSQLNVAIDQAAESGMPVPVNITGVSGNGQIGGPTPLNQQAAIGRFAVTVSGTVTATNDGAGGTWTLNGTVAGEPDYQDYGSDSSRGGAGSAATAALREAQRAAGGKNYMINFRGSQKIKMQGLWLRP